MTNPQSNFAQADIDHIADFNGDGYPDFHLVYTGAANLLTGGIAGVAYRNPRRDTATINDCSQLGPD
ncbi:MAG: hypothetical protein IPK54_14570 [Dokdonella sp.]|uniref:hypothetical protein n=1 Tax=Dokdonella sp. TaxID=2291710 RepID=UPI0025BBDCD9|nr:hypothetical protein [Dokdonella sp.]MBK8124760.1 hypothetical protein [Dokdonella sp.]